MEETSAAQSAPDAKCKAVGALVVGGRQVGWLRCSLEAGHEQPRYVYLDPQGNEVRLLTPAVSVVLLRVERQEHRQVLEWADDVVQLADWPEAYDPDEHFDVEVPLVAEIQLERIARGGNYPLHGERVRFKYRYRTASGEKFGVTLDREASTDELSRWELEAAAAGSTLEVFTFTDAKG